MKDYDITQQDCLSCGKMLDAALAVGGKRAPRENDITVCIHCGHIMAFNDKVRYRELTKEEKAELADNPTLQRAFKLADALKRRPSEAEITQRRS